MHILPTSQDRRSCHKSIAISGKWSVHARLESPSAWSDSTIANSVDVQNVQDFVLSALARATNDYGVKSKRLMCSHGPPRYHHISRPIALPAGCDSTCLSSCKLSNASSASCSSTLLITVACGQNFGFASWSVKWSFKSCLNASSNDEWTSYRGRAESGTKTALLFRDRDGGLRPTRKACVEAQSCSKRFLMSDMCGAFEGSAWNRVIWPCK